VARAAAKLKIEDTLRRAALVYLEDRAYDVLIGQPDPAKTGEVLRELGMEDLSLRMVRYALASSPRFEAVERRWTISTRFQDRQRPFERVVESVIGGYGRAMPADLLAKELAIIYDRPVSHYEEILPRIMSSQEKFFLVDGERYGLSSWLLTAESDEPADVLFDNFLSEEDVEPYRKAAAKIDWDPSDLDGAAEQLLTKIGHRVPIKVLAYFAWESLRDAYDPAAFYSALALSDRIEILSTQEAVAASQTKDLLKALEEFGAEIEEMPAEAEEEAVEAGPVTVSEADRDEIVALILAQGGTVTADAILEAVIEMSPGERGYEAALESLREALKDEQRIVRVGRDRWRPAGTIPDYVYEVPSVLIIPPHTPYETPEGDIHDQELEDEGLEAGLRQEIMSPLVQDVGDEDPEQTSYQPLDTYQRCALKYHHKAAGTMPLIQLHPNFFDREPEIIQITLVSEGVRREAWINRKTRLIYGLKDWYTGDMPVSGAAFELHRTERPGDYRFTYDNRTDALVFVPTSRLLELLELKNEIEAAETPVFDIITRILEHYRKGIAFVPLFTEVNLVRRVTRRLVASILSSYHCFHTRGKTGEWQYDAKKRSQGFNKAKRKYIKK